MTRCAAVVQQEDWILKCESTHPEFLFVPESVPLSLKPEGIWKNATVADIKVQLHRRRTQDGVQLAVQSLVD